ncbi:MAG: hypothetical protein HZA66_17610 [Rhodopseudomonas palustris]|uniref:Uncharacterized protein n=1 Tax=Rhodopseudomonas palustris TaxID=1076 RepID=A0A933W3G9_RHOPL|nr:hypothetical protein [Rhodopseudomonas palustris]
MTDQGDDGEFDKSPSESGKKPEFEATLKQPATEQGLGYDREFDKSSSEPSKKPESETILKQPDVDGVLRKPAFRRVETEAAARRHRGWSDINALIEDVAFDAIDRDIRVIFLISRTAEIEPVLRLSVALGDKRPMQRGDDGAGLGALRLDEVTEAIDTALAGSADGGAVFIDTLSVEFLSDAFLAAARRSATRPDADSQPDLSEFLRARSSRLIVLVVAENGQRLMPLLETLPEAVLLPWTGGWLAKMSQRYGFSESELDRTVGRDLRKAACITDSASSERESALYLLLRGLGDNADVDGPTGLVDLIKSKMEESRSGMRALAGEARTRFINVIRSDSDPIYGGPIGRTILLVALLVPNRPATAVLQLCRYLLPEGPAHVNCLTAVLRQTWQSGMEDDRRLEQPTRLPPEWGAVFDEVSDQVVDEIGLELTPKGHLQAGPKLARLDARELLKQNGRLIELARRVTTQAPATAIPSTLIPVLVDLATAIYRLDWGYLRLDDLVSIFGGMNAGHGDLCIGSFPERDLLNGILWERAPHIPPIGEQSSLSSLQMLADNQTPEVSSSVRMFEDVTQSTIDDLIDSLRLSAAGYLRMVLEVWGEHPQVQETDLDAFLERLFDRIPAESVLAVTAFLLLYGPNPTTEMLGRATLSLFSDLTRAAFTDRFRALREISGHVMRTALRTQDRPAAVDRWADALWVASSQPQFRTFGSALAVWLDDWLSTWEIPATAQDLHRGPREAGLMARLMIRPTGPRAGVAIDLLGRLFRRTSTERLEALQTLAVLAGGPRDGGAPAVRLEDLISQRVQDIFWIMIEEIDREEAELRQLQLDHLEEIVWGTLARHYSLTLVTDNASAVQAILDAKAAPESQSRSDARALLDLYAPATLMFWRFARFGARSLVSGEDDFSAMLATLERVAEAIAPPEHNQRARMAFAALTDVQERLVGYFGNRVCPRTVGRHAERLAGWRAVKNYLFPAVPSVVNLTGELQ